MRESKNLQPKIKLMFSSRMILYHFKYDWILKIDWVYEV